jgi:RNA polymerase sigma-70 factor, ECF subfamily
MKLAPTTPKLRVVSNRRPAENKQDQERLDDTRLLAAVRAGDPRAANSLYERCKPIVDRTLRKLLGRGDQEQQDISQQTMVEIVRSVDRYRGDCPLDAWIATLAAHVVYNSLRHRQVERRILSDTFPPDALALDQPGRRALQRSTIDRVLSHLETMDRGRAWAFLLHDVHGYDVREIAEIMRISPAAAQSRLVRGRKELHERIAADAELASMLDEKDDGAS